jgi:uncharacterized protein
MSSKKAPATGTIRWIDLTVRDAERVRAFYADVVGWEYDSVEMGGYEDYAMKSTDGEMVSGICHARGINADLPPTWLVYITVTDVEQSARRVVESGGSVIVPVKVMGTNGKYCVIRDPAGAVAALFQPIVETR